VFKELQALPPGRRLVAVVALVVSLILVTAAERDLQRRPPEEVVGHKAIWRLVSLNALGALAYFRFGRRRAVAAPKQ
jgi:hypothetical protein